MAASPSQATSTETVTVACKLPQGLILRVFTMEEVDVQMLNGPPKKVRQANQESARRFVVNGFAHAQNRAPNYEVVGPVITFADGTGEGGYALTEGCPKDLWEAWLDQNKTSMMVRNGLIFALPKRDDARAKGLEQQAIKSGLERLDPNNLPKVLRMVETDKEAMRNRVNNNKTP
jgi:hypothetical protein